MNIKLTEAQRRTISRARKPVRVVDPRSQRAYVLIPAEAYQRMRDALDAEPVDPSFYEFEEEGRR